jgi:predicted dehydrogenase
VERGTISGRRAAAAGDERAAGAGNERAVAATERAAAAATGRVLRVGVVGAGLIAQVVHLPALRALSDRFALAGVADPSPRARSGLGARYGVPAVADHRALLELPGLDAVVVCSPNGTHAAVTLDALDAGLHVLVEKPLCLTLADADRITARAREHGRVVQVGYMKRFEPAYESLLDALAATPAARLRHLTATTIDPGLAAAMAPAGLVAPEGVPAAIAAAVARLTAEQVEEATGAGDPATVAAFSDVLLGALVHDVNLVNGILDRLDIAVARVADAAVGAASAVATLELTGGARCSLAWLLEAGAGEFTEALVACTSAGVHRLEFPAPYQRPSAATHVHTAVRDAGGWTATARRGYGDAYARQLEHFHDCVTAGVACRTPAAQARRDIALLTGVWHGAHA